MRDIENALLIHAYSYVSLPGEGLYDKEKLDTFDSVMSECHIYIIGFVPRIITLGFVMNEQVLTTKHECLGQSISITWPPPPEEVDFIEDEEGAYFVGKETGSNYQASDEYIIRNVRRKVSGFNFYVKYVGQAFGKNGSRNARDRLQDHETLQKIALKGAPEGYRIQILCLAIQPHHSLVTQITGNSEDQGVTTSRIEAGLDKLESTTEAERVTLYEASMIRYFSPEYNKEFKESFPSTRLKILEDCYSKDIAAIIAEISIDELPFDLCSESILPKASHIVQHDLHSDEDRKAFFRRLVVPEH